MIRQVLMSSALSYRMWKSVCIGLLCLSCEALCNRGRNYGRSVVATPAGVVATTTRWQLVEMDGSHGLIIEARIP